MPLRGGESVGSAYVRIYADGSEVPGDIRRAMEDAEPSVREAGRRHGNEYADGFEEETHKQFKTRMGDTRKGMFSDLDDGLKASIQRLDLANDFLESPNWKKFVRKVQKAFPDEMGKAAQLALTEVEREFRDSGSRTRLLASMDEFGVRVRRAQAHLIDAMQTEALRMNKAWDKKRMDEQTRMLSEAYSMNRAWDKRRLKAQADMLAEAYYLDRGYNRRRAREQAAALAEAYSMDKAFNRRRNKEQADMLAEAYQMNKIWNRKMKDLEDSRKKDLLKQQQAIIRSTTLFNRNMKELADQVDRVTKGERGIDRDRLRTMLETLRRLSPSVAENSRDLIRFNDHIDTMEKRLRTATPRLSTMERWFFRLGDTMGRFFGKGSRNNFLNFFGSVVAQLIKFPMGIALGILKWFSNVGRAASEAFIKAGGGGIGTLAGLVEVFMSVASAAAMAGGAIIAFGAFIGVLGLIVGPVVSILAGLVGILVALSSSVIYAAIGALAGIGPLLIPIAGVVGGIIAMVDAIKNAKDESPALVAQIDRIKDSAKGLWDQFKDNALEHLPVLLRRANRVMEASHPLIEGLGKGFDRFALAVSDALDSPAMQHFFDRFGQFVPHAMEQLGNITGNLVTGVTGVLTAAIPSARRFLNWLDDISQKFSDWANSRKGRNEIKDFLDDAADSAESVGDFLKGAWHWLTKLIGGSKDEGDTLWERIGGKFEEWADYIDKHPDAFKDWMEDADDLAGSIGRIVDGLDHLVGVLNSDESQKNGGGLLDGIATALDGLAYLIEFVNGTTLGAAGLLNASALAEWGAGVASWFSWFFSTLGSGIWYVVGGEWVGDLFDGISDAFSGAGGWLQDQVHTFLHSISKAFSGGGTGGIGAMTLTPNLDLSRISGAIAKLPGLVNRGLHAVVGAFQGLAGRAASAAGDIGSRVAARFSGLPGRAADIAGQIVGRFGNVAERIGRAIGDVWKSISSHFNDIPGNVAGVVSDIVGAFSGLAGRILAQVGHIDLGSLMHGSIDPPGPLGPWSWARGGIAGHEMIRRIGEDGPEAVVPLDRDLSRVDPSVRMLSAIAQGKVPAMGNGGVVGGGVTANGWTIVTPTEDPRIVAVEVLNELVARAV